jgi:ribonuclease P protein component
LTSRRQFLEVYEKGRRAGTASFTVFGSPNSVGHSRLGLTVSRKVGGAVVRSRVKRLLRDIFRRHRQELEPPMDIVVNVRSAVLTRSTRQLEREFLGACARLASRGER